MSEPDICKAITRYEELCNLGRAPGFNNWGLWEVLSRAEGAWVDKMLDPNYHGIVQKDSVRNY